MLSILVVFIATCVIVSTHGSCPCWFSKIKEQQCIMRCCLYVQCCPGTHALHGYVKYIGIIMLPLPSV